MLISISPCIHVMGSPRVLAILSGICFLFLFLLFLSFLFVCSRWSFVDVPLIFSCPEDHVQNWRPPILLGVVEAKLVKCQEHTHTHTSLIPPWEDQCEWHRMTRMTRPDCAVICNLINTHTHTLTHNTRTTVMCNLITLPVHTFLK